MHSGTIVTHLTPITKHSFVHLAAGLSLKSAASSYVMKRKIRAEETLGSVCSLIYFSLHVLSCEDQCCLPVLSSLTLSVTDCTLHLHFESESMWDEFKAYGCIIQTTILDFLHYESSSSRSVSLKNVLSFSPAFHGGEIALNNLQIHQQLNPFTCSEINFTVPYYTHNNPAFPTLYLGLNVTLVQIQWQSANKTPKEVIVSQASEGTARHYYLYEWPLTFWPATLSHHQLSLCRPYSCTNARWRHLEP